MEQPAERRDDGSGSGDVYEGFFGANVFRTKIESDSRGDGGRLSEFFGKPIWVNLPEMLILRKMRRFHEKVFEKNGLFIDNWTLETPMKLIGKYEGERRQEEIWQKLLATRGSGIGALTESAALYQAVEDYAQGHIYFNKKRRTDRGIRWRVRRRKTMTASP